MSLQRSCDGKCVYATKKIARYHVKKQRKNIRPILRHTLEAYKCEVCGYWHIGKLKEKVEAAIEEDKKYRRYM